MLAICHTFYSLQAGVRGPKEWARAAAARGYTALAVADVNGLYGAVNFYREVSAVGLQPIVGVLLAWGGGEECTVLSTSDEGYRQVCRLVSDRHLLPGFDLFSLDPECLGELLFFTHSPSLFLRLAEFAGAGAVFLLPQPPVVAGRATPVLWDACSPDLAASPIPDAWFLDSDDREVFTWLGQLRRLSGRDSMTFSEHPGILLPEAAAWLRRFPEAGEISRRIEERCRFHFRFGHPLFPRIRLPAGACPAAHLRGLCLSAVPEKYTRDRERPARTRLEREVSAIIDRGFADYFLFVHEIVQFARDRGIPVEVRGSAASSIVSYLLGFTHCCPIEYDLCFERFLNPGRRDVPDIDVDIADVRRDEVIEFCYRRWGREHVAMIATILTYRSRSALRDAGRLLGVPQVAVTRFIEGQGGADNGGELARIAARLTGLPRCLGLHCAGLVITPCPLTDVTPLIRAAKGVVMSQYEKDQAELIGLVKMDLLGNSALTVIDEGRTWLDKRGIEFQEPGPRFDYKVNRLFAAGDTLGIYQCESPGMRQMCRALRPTNRREAAAALSLIRPGPAAAGMKETFIRRRRGLEPVVYRHPRMADFLEDTYGVMLFQEDAMKVAVNLAGYSFAEADTLRRAVSKQRGRGTIEAERHRFVFERAPGAGLDPTTAEAVWEEVARFASYGFCKAHASVYGRLAWLTARLKAHYPREFYTAILNGHKSMYPKRVYVWDALRHGIPVLAPDLFESDIEWTSEVRGIRAGLGIIRGLRRTLLREILDERRKFPFRDIEDLRRRVRFRAGELERLVLVGVCRRWGRREVLLDRVRSTLSRGPVLLPVPGGRDALPSRMMSELILTGIPFTAHPAQAAMSATTCQAVEMKERIGGEVNLVGILDACKRIRVNERDSTSGQEMSFVTLEDATGLFEIVLFPEVHRRFGGIFRHIGPYRVRGVVTASWDSITLELREAACA